MAAEAEQQLSLVPELGLQGDLFGGAFGESAAPIRAGGARSGVEPAGHARESRRPDAPPEPGDLDANDLEADARARPRRRRTGARGKPGAADPGSSTAASEGTAPAPEAAAAAAESEVGEPSDLPRWHHHGLVEPEQLTPMLRHYVELKRAHPERVLLYRLGDFFECFFEDAIRLSRLLELTLTGKEAGKALGRVPMAGIPHHAAERYCAELVRRGLSVALCDQLEEAAARSPAKGALLKRDITRVLTPGTVLEEGMLAARRNNWLCAVVLEGEGSGAARWGLAVADVSTGEFRVTERRGSDQLHQELLQLEAAEVVWPASERAAADGGPEAIPAWCPDALRLTPLPRTPFAAPEARASLLKRFRLASLDGLGLGEAPWPCGPPAACSATWTTPNPAAPSPWSCPPPGTPATSWCWTPRPAATWS